MRVYGDSNKVCAEFLKIFRYKIFDRNLQIKGPRSTTDPLAIMSRFLQELEHCSGENAEKLRNH